MKKRGQVTSFVLLGIVLVVIIVAVLYTRYGTEVSLKKQEISKEVSLPLHVKPVFEFVKNCVIDNAETGVLVTALQGGYVEVPEKSLKSGLVNVGYWYYIGEKAVPSKDKIEKELGKFLEVALPVCFDKEVFKDLEINEGEVSSRVKINDDNVVFSVYYPLEISKGNDKFKLDEEYSTTVEVRYGKVYDFAVNVVEKEVKDPDNIDLTFLLDSGFDVAVLPVDNNNLIYSITDKESKVNNGEFVFMFANRFGR